MNKEKQVIFWQSKLTGKSGKGKLIPKETAKAWRDVAEKEYPDLDHWVVTSAKRLK